MVLTAWLMRCFGGPVVSGSGLNWPEWLNWLSDGNTSANAGAGAGIVTGAGADASAGAGSGCSRKTLSARRLCKED